MTPPPWTTLYAAKLASAAQAIRCIPRGRRILIGSGAAEPTQLVEALCRHGDVGMVVVTAPAR